jgi:hypothetical protein
VDQELPELPQQQRVQVARLPDGHTGVRDSKNPYSAILRLTPAQWRAFLTATRRGEFDSPGRP